MTKSVNIAAHDVKVVKRTENASHAVGAVVHATMMTMIADADDAIVRVHAAMKDAAAVAVVVAADLIEMIVAMIVVIVNVIVVHVVAAMSDGVAIEAWSETVIVIVEVIEADESVATPWTEKEIAWIGKEMLAWQALKKRAVMDVLI